MTADYLVVGSGLTGATIARLLADAGRDVLMLERRPHLGGNVHDFTHPSGVRIHTYGPHYFRTGSRRLWEYVGRFARFYRHEACVVTWVDGAYEPWPIGQAYVARLAGDAWHPTFAGTPANFEDACLKVMPPQVFEKVIKGYTEKQWGVPVTALSPSLATRIRIREDDDPRLVCHRYQGLPTGGYEQWVKTMLAGITVITNTDYLQERTRWRHRKQLIFTGSIDEFFGCSLGRLKYRSQRRAHVYHPDQPYVLPCGQVNNPNGDGAHVRLLEWKHMMEPWLRETVKGTVITSETPVTALDSDAYEYPFPDEPNRSLYNTYAKCATAMPDVTICGRLGEYRYYDMDQAIGRAMTIARTLLRQGSASAQVVARAAQN